MEPIEGEAHLLCIPTQASCEVHTLFCPPPTSEDGWDPPARLLFRLLLRAPSVSSEAHFSQSPLLSFPHFPTAYKNPQVLTQGTLSLEVACSFLYLFPPQTRESVAHSADSLTSSLEVTFWFHHFMQNALTKLTNHRPAARGHGPFTVMVLWSLRFIATVQPPLSGRLFSTQSPRLWNCWGSSRAHLRASLPSAT